VKQAKNPNELTFSSIKPWTIDVLCIPCLESALNQVRAHFRSIFSGNVKIFSSKSGKWQSSRTSRTQSISFRDGQNVFWLCQFWRRQHILFINAGKDNNDDDNGYTRSTGSQVKMTYNVRWNHFLINFDKTLKSNYRGC
jgi:hypothetical protein